jgi:HEAT repeat protein
VRKTRLLIVKIGRGQKNLRQTQKETIQAALALILGPDTAQHLRIRAARKLARQGPDILPLLLNTLNKYPEITMPAWPWWPPQYEHCSRLLHHLCREAQIEPAELLQHPIVQQPVGPVLWISILEAVEHHAKKNDESLLIKGLTTPWVTVRYAAIMALATQHHTIPLQPTTRAVLNDYLAEQQAFPIRLAAAYALIRNGDENGHKVLINLLDESIPLEVRKAVLFILATEQPISFPASQQEHLITLLLNALHHPDTDIVQYASHALSKIAQTTTLPKLLECLETTNIAMQIAILTTLEELAQQKNMRQTMRQRNIPAHILSFCQSPNPALRHQACYTLASCGGEYASAALGTLVLNPQHPGHLEAIESLRQLQGVLRAPLRESVIRWLLHALLSSLEEVQVTVLDTLTTLLWQAYSSQRTQARFAIGHEILSDSVILQLLYAPGTWVRQQAAELLMLLQHCGTNTHQLPILLEQVLLNDHDAGVRACIAYRCGQLMAQWAIPGLIQTLLDSDEKVAQTALHALIRMVTPEKTIILTALAELATCSHEAYPVAQEAHLFLKKWRKAHEDTDNTTLHSF